jgi:hypothetical protein
MWVIAPLDQFSHPRHAGGAQELSQLGELLLTAVRDHCDQVGALPGPAPVYGRLGARLVVSLHKS